MNLLHYIKEDESIEQIKKDNIDSEIRKDDTPIIKKNKPKVRENMKPSVITKKIVQELLSLSSIEDIEAGAIKYFLKKNNLNDIKNKLIKELIVDHDKDQKVVAYFMKLNKEINIADLECLFELLIPSEDKRVNGAVYTPSYIVDYIVENVITKEGSVCDCSCGSGAFLLGSLKQLQSITDASLVTLLENNIYGVDISEFSVRRAKLILSIYAIINHEDKEHISFNIKCADSLEANWKTLFPEVFEKHGFDYVVGNPPYVRIQDLDLKLKDKLAERWQTIGTGNFNLYFAFFELGMNILKDTGHLGYITPNNYFTSLAGLELRTYFNKNKKLTRILNFNHLKIFENAQTYVCITFMSKSWNKEYFEYYYLEDKSYLSNLSNINFSRFFFKWLDDKKWRLMTESEYDNIRIIENIGTPLNKMCPIRVGIATLKDTVFFVEDVPDSDHCIKKTDKQVFQIEKNITKKIIKISSISSEDQIKSDSRRIIFPYKLVNGKYEPFSETELKEKYPLCYEYLLTERDELEKRDKGKKSYPVWFAWGRTQGMNYKGKRFYTRTFYDRPDFMLDEGDNFFCNGYAVFCKTHVRAIQKILNSKVMDYYVKRTSVEIEGNYQCYQKNFIEKFTIPEFNAEEWDYIESEQNIEVLNQWLFKKYGLKN
ncbi:MAG: HsdM family class I SAM-dependent methyltransferase [Candidatus Nanoarchaeia archaeon]